MNSLLLPLIIGLILGAIHYLRSFDHSNGRVGTANLMNVFGEPEDVNEAKDQEETGLIDSILKGIKGLFPDFTVHESEISQIITGIFKLAVLPLRAVRKALEHLIEKCAGWIENATNRNGRIEGTNDQGDHQWSLLVAVLCLFGLVFFTVANWKILCLGLECVLPLDARPIAYLHGKPLYPIPVVAMIMIAAEFLFSLMGRKYLNKLLYPQDTSNETSSPDSGKNGQKNLAKAVVISCYFGLVAFAAVEAVLAVIRTGQLLSSEAGLPFGSLPLWAVGIISFVVPLIAAFAFEYATQYLIQIGAVIVGLIAALLWIPFVIAELVVRWIHALIILVLEFLAMPVKLIPKESIQKLWIGKNNTELDAQQEVFFRRISDSIAEGFRKGITEANRKELTYTGEQGGDKKWFYPEKED